MLETCFALLDATNSASATTLVSTKATYRERDAFRADDTAASRDDALLATLAIEQAWVTAVAAAVADAAAGAAKVAAAVSASCAGSIADATAEIPRAKIVLTGSCPRRSFSSGGDATPTRYASSNLFRVS